MKPHRLVPPVIALALAALPLAAAPQAPDPRPRIAAQREAMAPLAYMDGVWRGPATTTRPSGEKHSIVQTERIGPFLGGTVKVLEGRGYGADGQVSFNALGIISHDVDKKTFSMRFFEMTLKRVGDTDWPAGNPIPPK